jgi:DNA-directed RNA polymerase subunit RPC12/RpoP
MKLGRIGTVVFVPALIHSAITKETMMAAKMVVCPSCGFEKNPPGSGRCASCGSKIEAIGKVQRTREEELERRYQQEGISLPWLGISVAVQGVLTAAIVFGLPRVVTAIDFEGGNGMTVCVPVWFLGGALIGMISPGRTFIEPMVASFVVALPSAFLLVENQTVRTMPTFLYVILSAIGILFTLVGSYIGERIQLGPPPKPQE